MSPVNGDKGKRLLRMMTLEHGPAFSGWPVIPGHERHCSCVASPSLLQSGQS